MPMPRARILGFLIVAAAALIASATAALQHPNSGPPLRKKQPVIPLPPPAPFVPLFDWEQAQYLYAHNELRRMIGMPPLVWSAYLTAEARAWAVQRKEDCNPRWHSDNQYGENIYLMNYNEFTPRDVVRYWFNENKLYNHTTLQCNCHPEGPRCECGHYLNVVWRTTRRVGCSGTTYCNHQKGVYIVCQYDPPGLAPGINPFTGHKI